MPFEELTVVGRQQSRLEMFSFLRRVVMNLLRRAGFRSIHTGQQDLVHEISWMLAPGGVSAATRRS